MQEKLPVIRGFLCVFGTHLLISPPPLLYLALTTLLKFIPFLLTVAQTCFLLKPHILFINEVQFASFTIFFFFKNPFLSLNLSCI